MKKGERVRQIVVYALFIMTCACIQVTFSQTFSLFGRTADFMLILVVLTGYLFGSVEGAVIGLIIGFLRDYFSGPAFGSIDREPTAVLGIGMLVFMYIGIGASLFFRRRFQKKLFLGLLQVMIFTMLYCFIGHIASFIALAVMNPQSEYHTFKYIIVDSLLPQLLVNLLCAVPILLLLRFAGPYKNGVHHYLVDGHSMEDNAWQRS